MTRADRTSTRGPTPPRYTLGGAAAWTVTTWLIAINVAVHVLAMLTVRQVTFPDEVVRTVPGPLFMWGYFSFDTAVAGGQVWRWLTFQFLHSPAGLTHLLFNMIGLYFFGPLVERLLGGVRFLAFYLLCGVAGPLAYLVFMVTNVLPMNPQTPMVGASAGLFGVLAAAAVMFPNRPVMLLFPPIPLPLRWLAIGYVAVAFFTVYRHGDNAGGEAAHIGGAAAGLLLIRNPHWLVWADRLDVRRRRAGGFSGRQGR